VTATWRLGSLIIQSEDNPLLVVHPSKWWLFWSQKSMKKQVGLRDFIDSPDLKIHFIADHVWWPIPGIALDSESIFIALPGSSSNTCFNCYPFERSELSFSISPVTNSMVNCLNGLNHFLSGRFDPPAPINIWARWLAYTEKSSDLIGALKMSPICPETRWHWLCSISDQHSFMNAQSRYSEAPRNLPLLRSRKHFFSEFWDSSHVDILVG
jgi:hypothetical protein